MSDVVRGRRSARAIGLMLASLVVMTLLDLGTKEWALTALSDARSVSAGPVCVADAQGWIPHTRLARPPRTLVPGVIELAYEENCGAAFSMLRGAPGWLRGLVFGTANIVAVVVLTGMFLSGRGGRAFAAAVPITLSGALGNVSDRLRHGFVVDFIRFDPELIRYPTFNVADIALAVGVGLILIDGLGKPQKPSATPT